LIVQSSWLDCSLTAPLCGTLRKFCIWLRFRYYHLHPVMIDGSTRQRLRINCFFPFLLSKEVVWILYFLVIAFNSDDGVNDNDRKGCRWSPSGGFCARRRTSMFCTTLLDTLIVSDETFVVCDERCKPVLCFSHWTFRSVYTEVCIILFILSRKGQPCFLTKVYEFMTKSGLACVYCV